MNAISLTKVSALAGGVRALVDITLTIDVGQLHAVAGPAGAGKTTLLDVLSGLRLSDAGDVVVLGDDVTTMSAWKVARLGVARTFAAPRLSPGSTVEANILAGRHRLLGSGVWTSLVRLPGRRRDEQAHRSRCLEIAEFVDVDAVLDQQAATLVPEVARRVELARALAMEPAVLLMDEPFADLAPAEAERVAGLLIGVRDDLGVTILFTSRPGDLVAGLADSVTALDAGRVVA